MKAYARLMKGSDSRIDSDKGFVEWTYYNEKYASQNAYYKYANLNVNIYFLGNHIIIPSLFLVFNLLAMMLNGFCLKSFIRLANKRLQLKKYYWSTAVVAALINSVWFGYNAYYNLTNPYVSLIISTIVIIIVTIILLLVVSPINAWYASMYIDVPLPAIFEHTILNYFCGCDCCSLRFKTRLVHTLALCHILWFVHRLVSSSVVVICYFVLAPAQVLAVVILFFSVITCTVFFLAITFHSCTCTLHHFVNFLALAFVCLQLLGILVLFTLFYLNLASNGLQSDNIGGIFLSLIPTAIFFIVGLIIKRHFFSKRKTPDIENNLKEETVEEDQVCTEDGASLTSRHQNATENTPLCTAT